MKSSSSLRIALFAASLAFAGAACSEGASSTTAETPGSDGGAAQLELEVASAGGTTVEVTITNTSDDEVIVVRPFVTPDVVLFRLIGPNGEIPFDGPYPRLAPVAQSDVARLAPGESASSQFDLADHFELPTGTLTVEASYRAREVHHGGLAMTVDPDDPVRAASIEIEVAG